MFLVVRFYLLMQLLFTKACVSAFAFVVMLLMAANTYSQTPVVSIIIDDMGEDLFAARQIIDLPGPVVSAIIPHTSHSAEVAELANQSGKEVMLHQPMQSVGNLRLGRGGIVLDMTQRQLQKTITDNLESIPHVIGVNNHMGSLITQHPGHMQWMMDYIKSRGDLFYIDSRTTTATVAQQMALETGIPNARRDVFLDHEVTKEAIMYQMQRLIKLAKKHGSAVAIGHPFPETIAVLQSEIPKLAAYGVKLVSITKVIALQQESKQDALQVKFAKK